jgi:DNA-binding NarL/FixJ family response regulator
VKYTNAEEVLPPDILRRVQRYHTGYLYVAGTREFYAKRRRTVMDLHRRGLSTREIAEKVHLCVRRVQQIIRENRDPDRSGT